MTPAAAVPLFIQVTDRFDVAEAWLGLAASALQTGEIRLADQAMQARLSRHAGVAMVWRVAEAVALQSGRPGWCSVDARGRLHANGRVEVTLDGAPLDLRWSGGTAAVPAAGVLEVTRRGVALLGSPIGLTAINAAEGFVEAVDGGLSGWAWHPGDPARDPVITIAG